MKEISIEMECMLKESDIKRILYNFSTYYPEVEVCEYGYIKQRENEDFYKFVWKGTIKDEAVNKIVKLIHHAEGIYDDTSAEYVHVEICVEGKWHGKIK